MRHRMLFATTVFFESPRAAHGESARTRTRTRTCAQAPLAQFIGLYRWWGKVRLMQSEYHGILYHKSQARKESFHA